MDNDLVAKLLRLSFHKLGKDISHLSNIEILEKTTKVITMVNGIDVNENRDEYLRIVYDIFEV